MTEVRSTTTSGIKSLMNLFKRRLVVGGCSPPPVDAKRKLESSDIVSDALTVKGIPNLESEIVSEDRSRCRLFTYTELAMATNDFHADLLIDKDKFGKTYKGQLQSTGEDVAVKVLFPHHSYGETEFLEEIDMLTKLNHRNLAKFIGYRNGGTHRILVYEFTPLGTLEHHLHGMDVEPLDWNTRMKIAAEVAQGLNYLVNEAKFPMMWIEVKSSNVLLDESHHAKVYGCFRIPKVGHCLSDIDLEVLNSCTSNFGNLLFEMISGQRLGRFGVPDRVYDLVMNRKRYEILADPRMCEQFVKIDLGQALAVVCFCTWLPGCRRLPNIREVVDVFDKVFIKKDNEADTA